MILFAQQFKYVDLEQISQKLGEEIVVKKNLEEALPELGRAEILVGLGHRLSELNAEKLAHNDQLKWLHSTTAGVDTIPFNVLKEKGILVTNSSGIHRTQIAEQVIGMMISFTRGLHYNLRNQLNKCWINNYPLEELYAKKLCIVGAGRIGVELARKAKAFDMQVAGIKYSPEPLENFDQVVGTGQLHEVLSDSDFVVNLLPLTPETTLFFKEAEFRAMKQNAIFLNFGRGPSVDEPALIRALENHWIRGAGLDVFEKEPLPSESPLWSMEKVIVSPHNAGGLARLEDRMIETFIKNYEAFRKGLALPNYVDLDKQY